MKKLFFLVISMLLSILTATSPVFAKDNVLGQEAEAPAVPTLQLCPEDTTPGTLCSVNGDGKVIWKGKVMSPERYASEMKLVTTLNDELRKRDQQLRQRDRKLDEQAAMLAQYQNETKEFRKRSLELEERKLTSQDKLIAVLEEQNQQMASQAEATESNAKALDRLNQTATLALIVIPATLFIGIMIGAFIVRHSIRKLSVNMVSTFGDIKQSLERVSRRLEKINETFSSYFKAEAKRQGIDFATTAGGSNGNGHRTGDTLPPGTTLHDLVGRVDTKPEPPNEKEGISDDPTSVDVADEVEVSVLPDPEPEEVPQASARQVTPDTDQRMRDLDQLIEGINPNLRGELNKRQPEFPLASREVASEETVVENPTFLQRIFGRRPVPAAS